MCVTFFSELSELIYTNFGDDRGPSWKLLILKKLAISCFVSKPQHLKGQILHFLTPCVKIRGGVDQISKPVFRAITYAPVTCFRFPICCSISKLERFKGDRWGQILHFFWPPVKIGEVTGEMFECHFVATRRTWPITTGKKSLEVKYKGMSTNVGQP